MTFVLSFLINSSCYLAVTAAFFLTRKWSGRSDGKIRKTSPSLLRVKETSDIEPNLIPSICWRLRKAGIVKLNAAYRVLFFDQYWSNNPEVIRCSSRSKIIRRLQDIADVDRRRIVMTIAWWPSFVDCREINTGIASIWLNFGQLGLLI